MNTKQYLLACLAALILSCSHALALTAAAAPDIAIASVSSVETIATGQSFTVGYVVKNVSNTEVNDFMVTYIVDGQEQSKKITCTSALTYGKTRTCKLGEYNFDTPGSHTFQITVHDPNGEVDENMSDNTVEFVVNAYDESATYERTVLLENFTTMECPNCPSAHDKIDAALNAIPGARDRVVWVCHHAGYGSDKFTTAEDNAYLFFYGSGGTYAPALMFDRTYMEDRSNGSSISYVPVHFNGTQEGYIRDIEERMAAPAYMDVHIAGEYDATQQKLSLCVYGNSAFETFTAAPRLNVWVMEDGLVATQKPNGSAPYTHNAVMRSSLTGTWGEPLEIADGKFSRTLEYYMPLRIQNPANTWVVAFVANYDSSNPNNCEVYNAAQARTTALDPIPEGIHAASIEGQREVMQTIWSADGRRQGNLQPGLNIVRTTYADGSVKAEKVLK